MIEEQLINKVMELNLISELLGVLLGESEYSDESAIDKLDRHSSRLLLLAIKHLQFIDKYGKKYLNVKVSIQDGGDVCSSYPEYFEAWVLAGIPGVSIHNLEQMLSL